jgi:Tfp pilus assembly protein PilO
MAPEPIPSMLEVAAAIFLIYCAIVILVVAIVAILSFWFWWQERAEERVTHTDRRIARYRNRAVAEIDALEAIPVPGEWLRWDEVA